MADYSNIFQANMKKFDAASNQFGESCSSFYELLQQNGYNDLADNYMAKAQEFAEGMRALATPDGGEDAVVSEVRVAMKPATLASSFGIQSAGLERTKNAISEALGKNQIVKKDVLDSAVSQHVEQAIKSLNDCLEIAIQSGGKSL